MAGVGFQLRRLLERDNYLSTLEAFVLSGIISSGPWVLSIAGVLIIGLVVSASASGSSAAAPFQVSVTYLMAASLLATAPIQLLFTRYISDRLYEKREHLVLPNLLGVLSLVTAGGGAAGLFGLVWLSEPKSLLYWILMLATFVILCDIWLLVVVVSCIKSWQKIISAFAAGYGSSVFAALTLHAFGVEGLLAGFLIGQNVLFFWLFGQVIPVFPSTGALQFDFLRAYRLYPSLAITGLLYVLGNWIDKFIFWFHQNTGESVLGLLKASPLYDMPIFLAYLSVIPGMAVFLIRMEADFSERCENFYRLINQGGTLEQILDAKDAMVISVRRGLADLCKVQGITAAALISCSDTLLSLFGISPAYQMLLNVDLVAVAIQLLFLATLNVLFYLDERASALLLCAIFVVSNAGLTLLTQLLGPVFYGYGFAGAMLATAVAGLLVLGHKLNNLEYKTFVLQPVRF